jgi:hypothetical protein
MDELQEAPYWHCQLTIDKEEIPFIVENDGNTAPYLVAVHVERNLGGLHLEMEPYWTAPDELKAFSVAEFKQAIQELREEITLNALRTDMANLISKGIVSATYQGKLLDEYQVWTMQTEDFEQCELSLTNEGARVAESFVSDE